VTISGNAEWLLVNVEVGYCQLVTADGPIAPAMIDIGYAAISAIEYHLPDDRDEDNFSVSRDPGQHQESGLSGLCQTKVAGERMAPVMSVLLRRPTSYSGGFK